VASRPGPSSSPPSGPGQHLSGRASASLPPRLGRRCRPRLGPRCPPWLGRDSVTRLGRDSVPRLGLAASSRPKPARPGSPGQAGLPRPAYPGRLSQAGIPSPGRHSLCRLGWLLRGIPAGLGQNSLPQADLAPSGPGFTFSGTHSSSGIDSSVLCQSWDALWIRLAHPSLLYAGLGMPLGSDQHTLHLLVSLILRRRIRLMA
jgi:hypothetical protein